MSGNELSHLVRSLTQAVERVRVTVQMRRLSSPALHDASGPQGAIATPPSPNAGQQHPHKSGPSEGNMHLEGGAARADANTHKSASERTLPPPMILANSGNVVHPPASAAGPLSSERQRRSAPNLDSQHLDDLHKAMPLRRPKPYNYSRASEDGNRRSSPTR